MSLPPLPPGFELIEDDIPPLPPGFELIDDDPGLEIDIVGGTPVSSEQFERDNPTEGMGRAQKFAAGLGASLDTLGRGLRDTATDAARYFVEANPMLFDESTAQGLRDARQRQRDQEAERRATNEPLLDTGWGLAGNVGGTIGALVGPALPLRGTMAARALLPQTMKGNAALGGALGFIQPTAQDGERGRNTAFGAGAGAAGAGLASLLQRFTQPAREASGLARMLGIDLKASPGRQVEQVSAAAQRLMPPEKGAAMPPLRDALRVEREATRQQASALFDAAKGASARVRMSEVQALSQQARKALADFDVAMMPGIARRLDELEELSRTPNAREAQLKAAEQWRRRISLMSPKDGSPEQAAATVLKRQYDDWITSQFNNDMIVGDKAAVEAWRAARSAWSDFKGAFDANKTIRELATKPDLTQEQMRGWLFNANSVGAKRESGAVVARLNQILGPDSPQMEGLRSEVLIDIVEPLTRRTPNMGAFLDQYDKFIGNNPTLKRELFPHGMGDMDEIVKFARGIVQRPGATVAPKHAEGMVEKVLNGLTRYVFGHGIARGGVRVKAATGIAESLRQATVGAGARKNILREYLGTSPTQPIFPRGAGGVSAAGLLPVVSPPLPEQEGLEPPAREYPF